VKEILLAAYWEWDSIAIYLHLILILTGDNDVLCWRSSDWCDGHLLDVNLFGNVGYGSIGERVKAEDKTLELNDCGCMQW
jgi:hypothetical protein